MGRRIKPKPKHRPRVRPRLRVQDLPKMVETGEPVRGYRGAKLFKGTYIRRVGEASVGKVLAVGPEQCEVQWLSGQTQAEITEYLERA